MEQDPDAKVEKPLKFRCDGGCNRVMETDFYNTAYFVYERQPWFNHTQTVCEDDGRRLIYWIYNHDIDRLEYANQFAMVPEQDCEDEDLVEFYKEYHQIEDVAEQEITGSQNKILKFLHFLLNNKPSEEILDELSHPQPRRTLGEKWL